MEMLSRPHSGLRIALREAGIAAVPTLADARPAPGTYSFLPGFELFVPSADLNTPDVFVALDTPNPERLGQALRSCRGGRERSS